MNYVDTWNECGEESEENIFNVVKSYEIDKCDRECGNGQVINLIYPDGDHVTESREYEARQLNN